MARAFGGCKPTKPGGGGAQTEKIPKAYHKVA